jgi:hypothetical protein
MFGKIKITDFGKRHFDSKFGGTKITDKTPEEFECELKYAMEGYEDTLPSSDVKVMDGYAPFCKLIAIKNFTNARVGSMPIDMANYQYLRSGYSSRNEKELPVMSRWFELPLPAPVADYLIIVVYSREQLEKEFEAQSLNDTFDEKFDLDPDSAWGVVAILGQTHQNEEPMQPITMMRNALGINEGGSGVSIDREKYLASVEFWKNNAIVKS